MSDPRKGTLAINTEKSATVFATGSVAANTVVVEFDRDANQLDILTAIDKVKQLIIEDEY